MASASELKQNYQILAQSVLQGKQNWSKEMKYLVPALTQFVITVISKHPDFAKQYVSNIA